MKLTGSEKFFSYSLDFSTTINAGVSGNAQVKIDADSVFVVTRFAGALFLPVTQTFAVGVTVTLVQGTSIPRQPFGGTGANANTNSINRFPLPTFDMFRLQLGTNDYLWQNQPIRLSALCGDAQESAPNFVFPLCRPGDTIFGTLFNDTGGNGALNVQGSITLCGYKDYDIAKYQRRQGPAVMPGR